MNYIQRKIKSIYEHVSTKQVTVFSIIFILFTAIILPFVSSQTERIIGVTQSPDTNFTFNVQYIMNIVDIYGVDGRRFYVLVRWTFDIIWPIIYTLFLGSSIAYFARRSNCRFTYKPLWFVLLAVGFDLFENINATIVMLIYPTQINFFVYLLIIASILKWVFISLCFAFVILLLIRYLVSFRKNTLSE